MEITEQLSFSHKDRKDIYEYVESHGTVREEAVRRALNMDPGAFGHHVTILRRDGYIRKVDGKLQVAFTEDDEETFESDDGIEYCIRTARQVDLSGLIGAIRTVAEEGTYIEAETVADLLEHEDVVLRHNDVRSRMIFVATIEEDVVGWVHLDLPEAEKLRHTAVLTVGLLPEYRGHGIGDSLLRRGVEWAETNGYEKLYNSVPATNERAIEFLENHGWVTEAIRTNHYRIDDRYVDEVMMAVFLE